MPGRIMGGLTLALLALLAGCQALPLAGESPAPISLVPPPLLTTARQLVVVRSAGPDAPVARLTRFQREDREQAWQPVGTGFPVSLGRQGLGWGTRGGQEGADQESGQTQLQALELSLPLPTKAEGDGRAPAGLFPVGPAFGEGSDALARERLPHFPYVAADATLYCVDDGDSPAYNRLQPWSGTDFPWRSAEAMVRQDGQYRWGAVVQHNTASPRPGAGSCIFLHIWSAPGAPTAGCTAMAETNLLTLLNWLRADHQPVLLQLPESAYQAIAPAWALPALPALP